MAAEGTTMGSQELVQHQDPQTHSGKIALDDLDGTLTELFGKAAELYEQTQDFLVHKAADGSWQGENYPTVRQRVLNVAAALVSDGVKKGDRVAIMSANRPEWAIADLGILHARATSVPIYNTLDVAKTGYILKDSGAKVVFVEDEHLARLVREAIQTEKVRSVKRIVVFEAPGTIEDEDTASFTDYEHDGAAAATATHNAVGKRTKEVEPGDLASIVYTSGTTGPPKGVMLTHNNFHSNVVAGLREIPMQPQVTCLSFLPLSHVFERMAGYYTMIGVGATICYAEDVTTVPNNIMEVRPHVMASVPRLYEKMYAKVNANVKQSSWIKRKIFDWAIGVGAEAAELRVRGEELPARLETRLARADRLVFSKIKEKTGGRLQFFVSGGAPLSKQIEVFFAAMGIDIYQGYGLTETSPVVSCNTPNARRFGSVGRPIDGVEVMIDESAEHEPVEGRHPVGEILVSGKCVMDGYWKKEKETKQVMKKKGKATWFCTGDIGYLDDDGFLYITDRKKELIVLSNGKNVAPQPVENDLKLQPHIAQAVLIGDNRNYITALVAPDFEALAGFVESEGITTKDPEKLVNEPKVQELIKSEVAAVNGRLSRYEQIKKFRILPRELTQEQDELTPTLKIKRRVIDEHFGDIIDEMYEN
jgi:long-chain acyl-CoA synthetase